MSAYRTPGHVEPTLTPEEEARFYRAIPLVSAPANVSFWAVWFVGMTIAVVLGAIAKTIYFE